MRLSGSPIRAQAAPLVRSIPTARPLVAIVSLFDYRRIFVSSRRIFVSLVTNGSLPLLVAMQRASLRVAASIETRAITGAIRDLSVPLAQYIPTTRLSLESVAFSRLFLLKKENVHK